MKIAVFTGPTISQQEAEPILSATYFPPARQGDVLSCVCRTTPDVIAIIDSVVFSTMPVWHKEILYALDRGIAVYGSSAIGALRAAELERFGMRGVGRVYQQVAAHELEDDDEVLVAFESNGQLYHKRSEAMVNLRATFAAALAQSIITPTDHAALIAVAKALYYPQRTFDQIFTQAVQRGVPAETIAQLRQFVAEQYVDVQKADAIELLATLRQLTPDDLLPRKTPSGSYGELFYMLYDKDRKVSQDEIELRQYAIRNYVMLNHPGAEDLNFHALNRKLTLLLADIFGITASQTEIDNERRRFKSKHQLIDNAVFQEWLCQNDLSRDDFMKLMQELARIRKTHQWYIMLQVFRENVSAILEELKLTNEYPEWKEKTALREHFVENHDDQLKRILNDEDFVTLLQQHLRYRKFPWNISVTDSLLETGMNINSLVIELSKERLARDGMVALIEQMLAE